MKNPSAYADYVCVISADWPKSGFRLLAALKQSRERRTQLLTLHLGQLSHLVKTCKTLFVCLREDVCPRLQNGRCRLPSAATCALSLLRLLEDQMARHSKPSRTDRVHAKRTARGVRTHDDSAQDSAEYVPNTSLVQYGMISTWQE
jgi:Ribonuclease G/E